MYLFELYDVAGDPIERVVSPSYLSSDNMTLLVTPSILTYQIQNMFHKNCEDDVYGDLDDLDPNSNRIMWFAMHQNGQGLDFHQIEGGPYRDEFEICDITDKYKVLGYIRVWKISDYVESVHVNAWKHLEDGCSKIASDIQALENKLENS